MVINFSIIYFWYVKTYSQGIQTSFLWLITKCSDQRPLNAKDTVKMKSCIFLFLEGKWFFYSIGTYVEYWEYCSYYSYVMFLPHPRIFGFVYLCMPRARPMHTQCTLCTRYVHAQCTLRARPVHAPFTLCARSVHDPCMHSARSVHALCALSARSVHAPWMLRARSKKISKKNYEKIISKKFMKKNQKKNLNISGKKFWN